MDSTNDYESSGLGSIPSTPGGTLAQLVERSLSMREVGSSILPSSTVSF